MAGFGRLPSLPRPLPSAVGSLTSLGFLSRLCRVFFEVAKMTPLDMLKLEEALQS